MLSKGVKFGVEFSKQGLGAWCCVGAVWVLNKQAKVWCRMLSKDMVRVLSKQTSKDKMVRV